MKNEQIDVTSITLAAYRMRNQVIADMIRAGWKSAVRIARHVSDNAIPARFGRGHRAA